MTMLHIRTVVRTVLISSSEYPYLLLYQVNLGTNLELLKSPPRPNLSVILLPKCVISNSSRFTLISP